MDNSKVQLCGTTSAARILTHIDDASTSTAGCSNNPSDFVNHGFVHWYQIRQKWTEKKRPVAVKHLQQLREPRISWDATYDSLLGCNRRFSKPVPLREMVDFLVDVWEQEGMYD